MAIKLLQDDIDFIYAQLTLPGNNPLNGPAGSVLSNTGIRDVLGIGNNVLHPLYGAADQIFPRVTPKKYINAEGTLDGYTLAYDSPSYGTRGINLVDSSPRIISNLIANQKAITNDGANQLPVLDNPDTTPGGRVSPITGNMNPLPYSTYMTFFGQFFDHGLDFVHKGVDGVVMVPVLPGDSQYKVDSPTNFIMADRTNTSVVSVDAGSKNDLVTALGLTENDPKVPSFTEVVGSTVLGNITNNQAGNLVLSGHVINIAGLSTPQQVLDAINAQSSSTGVVASLNQAGNLVLTPLTGESMNTVSPFIDLSQSYGSVASHTVFLREYDANGNTTGRLVSGTTGGMATWADIKANAENIGIFLHDYNVTDVPLVFIDANGKAWLQAIDNGTGEITNISNSAKNQLAGKTLLTTGHAFLDDMAVQFDKAAQDNLGDFSVLADRDSLNQHFVAGDGRANENLGLTAIHDVFHAEHNRVLLELQSHMTPPNTGTNNTNNYVDVNGNSWTGEMLFQAAKLVTEMEYQHIVFGEFARKLSPNINAFAAYDISVDPAITAEFAHAVYRFGHSMLTETVGMELFDQYGISTGLRDTDLIEQDVQEMTLLNAFLHPQDYTATTAGEIAIGASKQVGNAIDQYVTPALQDNFLGIPFDLATLNIIRGRDTGIGTLNQVRQALFDQTGMTTLAAYTSWDDFGANLLDSNSLVNFIMAYDRDCILTNFGVGKDGNPHVDTEYWDALQLNDHEAYATALADAALVAMDDADFMTNAIEGDGIGEGFNNIDLWIGGLAEAKVTGGMLGSTFDFIFAAQMIKLQNNDRFYYLDRLAGTNLLADIEGQLLSDVVMRNTGVTHLYPDIFSVADEYIELGDPDTAYSTYATNFKSYASRSAQLSDKDQDGVGKAGFVGDVFYGNPGDYLDARGVLSPNGKGNESELIGGTSGADNINALGGNDAIYGDNGNDTIEGGAGNDFVHGGNDNDLITDSEGDDLLWGEAGDDTINGGNGIDQVFGGDGADKLYGGLGADIISGGAGDDVIYGDNGAIVSGVMDPTGDADVITAGAGNDTIYGGGGADTIDAGDGNDWVYGGAGADAMLGWSGNDRFVMDASDLAIGNAIDGGLGNDIVDYSLSEGSGVVVAGRRQGITVNLSNPGPAVVPVGVLVADTYLSVEGVIGTKYDDSLTGGTGVVTDAAGAPVLTGGLTPIDFYIDGGLGDDTMTGGLGNDTYVVDSANDLIVEVAAGGTDTVLSSALNYTLSAEIENLTLTGVAAINGTGNAINNTIIGNSGNNILDGGGGADTMTGGAGDDTYVVDNANDVIIENQNEGTDTVQSSITYTIATNANLENITLIGNGNINATGNTGNNVLTGNGGSNSLSGGNGVDTLNGGDGNDTLNGGAGNDSLVGGAGNDTYIVDATSGTDVINETGGGTDTVQSTITYTIASNANLENITLTGSGAVSATGNNGNNVLTGNTGNNTLSGGNGSDTLIGGIGADVLNGDSGNDTFRFASTADLGNSALTRDVIQDFASGDKIDLTGFDGNTQSPNVQQLTWIGTDAFTDLGLSQVRFNTTSNMLEFNTATGTARELTNFVDFEIQLNTVIGFNDFIGVLNGAGGIMNGTNGNDTINGSAGNDTISGGNGNDVINGNAGNDNIDGGAGNDTINGGAGNDSLNGGNGIDLINGGVGTDTLTGGGSADTFVFSAAGDSRAGVTLRDIIIDFKTGGADRIDLRAIDANAAGGTANDAFVFRTNGVFTGAGQLRAVSSGVNNVDTIIQGNTDANINTIEFEILLKNYNSINISSTDFFL